jgi:hypothetical protein
MLLPLGLCVYVKLCLTLREEHILRTFENWLFSTIFGRKSEEVAGGWRRLYPEYGGDTFLRIVGNHLQDYMA